MARPDKTVIDYLIIAVCPVLIGLMVGSLAFFVLECTYDGRHDARIRWIVALFVVAVVGIGRISIEMDKGRAGAYGIALASVTFLAVMRFSPVTFPVMCLIVGLTWWASHKLTWNCTFIDEDEEDVGRGLLEPEEDENKRRRGWSFLGSLFIEPEERRHPPGAWIVYFALVAIPLFTLGQWMIPASEPDARQNAAQYVGLYLLSALLLLAATSLLGLRRYLRRRGAEMPNDMAAAWLVTAGVLVLLCAWLAGFLPRPGTGQESQMLASLRRFINSGQPSNSASYVAPGTDAAEENPEDYAGSGREEEPGPGGEPHEETAPEGGKPQGEGGAAGEGSASGGAEEKGEEKTPQNTDGSGKEAGGQSGKGVSGGENSGGADSRGSRSEGAQSGGSKSSGSQSGGSKSKGSKSEDSRRAQRSELGEGQESRQNEEKDDSADEAKRGIRGLKPPSSPPTPRPGVPPFSLTQLFGGLTTLLRWVAFLALLCLVAYWTYRHRDELIQAIREIIESLRAFWQGFFGTGRKEEETVKEAAALAVAAPRKRFGDLTDPFRSGLSGRMDSRRLVEYTFEAVETWAADLGMDRREEETPRQFLGRLRDSDALPPDALNLLNETYSRTTYDAFDESAGTRSLLDTQFAFLWRTMSENAPRPAGLGTRE